MSRAVHGLELVVFDLDGTLVDSFEDISRAMREALAAADLEATDELMALVRRGVGLEQFFERATGQPAAGPRFQTLVTTYRRSYFHGGPFASKPYPGVVSTLEALRKARPELHLAVATTKRTDMAQTVVRECGLEDCLDQVRGSDGLPHKPDPALLREVARVAGRRLNHAVMVGDTDRDILAARAGGCAAVGVSYGGFGRDEMEALGERAPQRIIDRFEELLDVLEALRPGG